jgi:lysophospholipase L1-like esterase
MLSTLALVVANFALKDGDRVVFYGDSITEQMLYTNYVETLVRTRFPSLNVQFVSRGVGGDSAEGGWMGSISQRITRDVKPEKPTRIVVMLGMNDGKYLLYNPENERVFRNNYRKMLDLFQTETPTAKMTLIRSSPYDEVTRKPPVPGYNQTLLNFGRNVEAFAKERGHEYVDFNEPVVQVLKKGRAQNNTLASSIIPDAVHPAAAGHVVMAGQLVRKWGIKGLISNVWFDAEETRLIEKESTTISDLKRENEGWSWTQDDLQLPFPYEPEMFASLVFSDFNEAINRQQLRVTRLERGEYRLRIDGMEVGSWTAKELSEGVNLSYVETPMMVQAKGVMKKVFERNLDDHNFWREGSIPEATPHSELAKKAHQAKMQALTEATKMAAMPKAHRFELMKI